MRGNKNLKDVGLTKKAAGFSLVEIMVVVAIIGIIGAVAYPSYQGYIQDTLRAQAVADLQLCAMEMDRFYSNGFTYVGGDARCTLWSPSDRAQADREFTLSVPVMSATTYTIRAVPVDGGATIQLTADGTQTEIP